MVYKYDLFPNDYATLKLPKGYKILSFQAQKLSVCIWALVDPEAELEEVKFRLCGTGHAISEENLEYIGTTQKDIGITRLVWHLFKLT